MIKIARVLSAAAAVTVGTCLTFTTAPAASASDEWTQTMTVNLAPDGTTTVSPQDADGSTWGPGGLAAQVSIQVKGQGVYVRTAAVSYHVGYSASNACTDSFEIAYWKAGKRLTASAKGHCTPWRTSHTFQVNRQADNNSKFCGSVVVGGTRSGYACINIRA